MRDAMKMEFATEEDPQRQWSVNQCARHSSLRSCRKAIHDHAHAHAHVHIHVHVHVRTCACAPAL
eukprot:3796913-Prymnesium_polylepis.1